MTLIAYVPTTEASGYPPNVEPSEPGVNKPSTSSLPATKETGRIPPPAALPQPIISGTTPNNWCAKFLPVLPKPV